MYNPIGLKHTKGGNNMIYTAIAGIAVMTLIAFFLLYKKTDFTTLVSAKAAQDSRLSDEKAYLILLLGVAFALRVFLSTYYMEDGDMSAFSRWGQEAWENGIRNFYASHGATTYPPLYILILYGIAGIRSLFGIASMSVPDIVLLKLPAILFDLAGGVLLYHIARKKFSYGTAMILSSLYLFNPAAIICSAIWGQVDSLYVFFIGLTCYLVSQKKLKPAYFTFAIGFLLKTQTIIFTPILIYGIVDQVFLENFNWKKFFSQLFTGLGAIAMIALVYLPFLLGQGSAVGQFSTSMTDTLTAFPYASINADNIWTMLGLNWADQSTTVLFLSCRTWGTIAIIGLVIGSAYISFRCKKDPAKYPLIGAFIMSTMFLFSVRMHERYLFPALFLLILAFILKPNKETFYSYTFFTIGNFLNTAYALFIYNPQNFSSRAMIPMFTAFGILVSWIYLMKVIRTYYSGNTEEQTSDERLIAEHPDTEIELAAADETAIKPKKAFHFQLSQAKIPFTKKDLLILLVIMAIYSVFALFNLGNREAPETAYTFDEHSPDIILDLGEEKQIGSISYYLGPTNDRSFILETGNTLDPDSGTLTTYSSTSMTMVSVFAWDTLERNVSARYIRMTASIFPSTVHELVIQDQEGNILRPVNADKYAALFDEENLFPERSSFRDSTIFDEIYHARTAYEFLHGMTTYETTHPPLGKIFISIGIAAFGMNPFGWRIIGTLFGIAMLAVIYLFGKQFFRKTWAAAMVCLLFASDFMHFTQTRIATIDVYITFFILCMYYFMYRYCSMSFYDTPIRKTFLPLGLCGISMGLGIASKWTGIYAGAGLAVIFFCHLGRRFREYRHAKKTPEGETDGISHAHVLQCFRKNTLITLTFCIGFFILIPIGIYVLSYIPFISPNGTTGLIAKVLENQEYMFSYHSGLVATHPYSSSWYEWPMIVKPVLYYHAKIGTDIVEGISAFGNPLVWWTGFLAFFYMGYAVWKDRDRKAAFLMIGYLAQYLPWILIPRYTFLYHYFTCVPFLILMIGYSACRMYKKKEKRDFYIKIAVYCTCAIGLFLFFYPMLSGYPVARSFAESAYRWFRQWYLFL